MTIHRLKTVSPYYEAVRDEVKSFEIRKNDRDFHVGDTLVLDEWHPDTGYSGSFVVRGVLYIVQGAYGLPDDVCVMGITPSFAREQIAAQNGGAT